MNQKSVLRLLFWSICGLQILLSYSASAYFLSPQSILQKTVENCGTGVFQIEQEIVFPTTGAEPVIMKEIWYIKDQDTMRVQVTSTREFKDQVKWSFIYYNGQKYQITPQGKKSEKISPDFFERFFHFRKPELLTTAIVNAEIAQAGLFQKKPSKVNKDWLYPQDDQLRLARIGGYIAYAFGTPTPPNQDTLNPGLWIEQDSFAIRKLRLPSKVEVVVDKTNVYSRGLIYPKTRTIRWGESQIQINTLNAIGIADRSTLFTASNLEADKTSPHFETLPNRKLIEDFYTRFR